MAAASSTTTMSAPMDEPAVSRQVPVTLQTSEVALSIPQVPYLIPTSWRRAQLSTLVNRLLQQGTGTDAAEDTALPSVPFDFIIDGELLRTTLSKYLESKGLTEESTIQIEYVRSTLPPKFTAAFEHDDWISGVDASREGLFLTSSYDGSLRVFGQTTIDKALVTFRAPGMTASLTDACWLASSSPSSSRVATVGMDGMLRVCSLAIPEEQIGASQGSATLESASLIGAFDTPSALSSVRATGVGKDERLLTSGWDGCIAIWSSAPSAASNGVEDTRATKKRRKAIRDGAEPEAIDAPSMSPLSTLWHTPPAASGLDRMPGQNARVSSAMWLGGGQTIGAKEAASAGWDGSVRLWDIEEGRSTLAKTSDKVILCMDALSAGRTDGDRQSTLVTGHMDRSAALWDMRGATASNIAVSFNNAHSGPVHAVRAHPMSSNLFATGGHDGAVKLWDVRSPRAALFALSKPQVPGTASAATSKMLALDWDPSGQTIVAGGEDKQLAVFRGQGIGRDDQGGSFKL